MDAENRVFIYFTLEDALKLLCCGHTKAVALFAEVKKVGLIERKKQGHSCADANPDALYRRGQQRGRK